MRDQTRKRPAVAGPGAENIEKFRSLYSIAPADPRHAFIGAMTAAGVVPSDPSEIIADGTLRRFHVEGDRRGSRNGWSIFYGDGIPSGAYGSWRASVSGTWCAKGRDALTPAEQSELRRRMEAARAARLAEQAQRHDEAAARAVRLWHEAAPADPFHPYLTLKRIQPHRARQRGSLLVLPVVDFKRRIHSLQFIAEDGTKKMLTGGAKRGNFIPVAGFMPGRSRLLVSEGFATAATLAEMEPHALVLAAIDAGNIEPVAVAARLKWPDMEIVICCDADPVGIAKGRAAAIAAGALVAVPDFPEGAGGTDFNDLAVVLAGGDA